MNEEVKAAWVAGLRSGEYRQGRGYLNNNGEFCCLGVLCELAYQRGVTLKRPGLEGVAIYGSKRPGMAEAWLPPDEVVEWAGLPDENPELTIAQDDSGLTELTSELNDRLGLTLAEIADLIEEQL